MDLLDFIRITPKKRKVKIKGRKGVIYHNPSGFKRYFFHFGNWILLLALTGFVYLYYPLGKSIYNYKFHSKQQEVKLETFEEKPQEVAEKNSDYYVQIPKILASSKIVPNVSPYDPEEYLKVLNEDVVAQSKDSFEPGSGKGKTTYLFAHSSRAGIEMVRKNSVFYLLGQLNMGDVIYIKYGEKVYTYIIYMKRIINASEVEYLNFKDENKEVLILQTCWPIGTDWKRLLVFAQRV